MREILFRGKRVDNGEWVIGDGIHYPKSHNWKGTCWIDGMAERVNDWVQVIPETVGQYTGLTDKNGTKIFEGDIVNLLYSDFYGQDRCGKFVYDDMTNTDIIFRIETSHAIEVIGNIHDNPELLGVE